MKLTGNTLLITGGSNGIGLALAKRFVARGNEVIVCGRREDLLQLAKEECPELHTLVCDVGEESERNRLVDWVAERFPKLNVLVNNAGIQNRSPRLTEAQDWKKHHQEISINLEAPIHLSMCFLPLLLKQQKAAICNVSSGLAFAPIAMMSTYCATKAALHSFTLSLRHQLKTSSVEVIEIVPPAVNTDLGGKGLHTFGVSVNAFADAVMERLSKGEVEIGYETSDRMRLGSREDLDRFFEEMNQRWG
jgi:uncharacterized oxidoreductase